MSDPNGTRLSNFTRQNSHFRLYRSVSLWDAGMTMVTGNIVGWR